LAQSAHGYFEHVVGLDFGKASRPEEYNEMAQDIMWIVARAGLQLVEASTTPEPDEDA
jgi:hypothetical protein